MTLTWGTVLTTLGVVLVALVTAVGAWFTARSGGRVSPYDSLAKRVTDLEQQRKDDIAEIEAQRHKIIQLEQGRADDKTEITSLQRRVAGMFDDRDDLVRYIRKLHQWVTAGARPPAPVIPAHLADVVPPWVPDDGNHGAQTSPPSTTPEEPS